ncbi:hypothetical protein [Azospirillum largimobile]
MAETSLRRLHLRVEGARRDLTSAPPRLQGRSAGENRPVPRIFHPVAAPYRRIGQAASGHRRRAILRGSAGIPDAFWMGTAVLPNPATITRSIISYDTNECHDSPKLPCQLHLTFSTKPRVKSRVGN